MDQNSEDFLSAIGLNEGPAKKPGKIQVREEKKTCPFCAETILADAIKCKHCGEFVDAEVRRRNEVRDKARHLASKPPKWNRGVAAVLSFILPGLGQLYKGRIITGVICMFLCPSFYVIGALISSAGMADSELAILIIAFPLALFFHLVIIADAYTTGDPQAD